MPSKRTGISAALAYGSWPKTIKQKAFLFFFLIVLLAIGNVLSVNSLLQSTRADSAVVNVAGKMRMLSQRISLEAILLWANPERDGLAMAKMQEQFNSAYTVLRDGGTAFDLEVNQIHEKPRDKLLEIAQAWGDFLNIIDSGRSAYENINQASADLIKQGDVLLQYTESFLDSLVEQAILTHKKIQIGVVTLFALDLILLLFAWRAINRSIMQPIASLVRQSNEFASGNYAARSKIPGKDELGELGNVLNQSAAHITDLLNDLETERIQLAKAQTMFQGLAANTVAGIFMIDANMHLTYASHQLLNIFGYDFESDATSLDLEQLFTTENFQKISEQIKLRLSGAQLRTPYEVTAICKDGSKICVEMFGSLMRLDGKSAIIGVAVDITARKQAEMSLKRAALVYANTSEAMVITDADGTILDINPAFTTITGYSAADAIGMTMRLLASGRQDKGFYSRMWQSISATGKWNGDLTNKRKSGEEFIERLSINTSYNQDGSVNCRIGLFSDVTEKRRREASIWHQAHYDHLTQLPNRQMFNQSLQSCMERSAAARSIFALVFVDLDFFKEVNDTFGHDEGDELLRIVAQRLRGCVRGSDLVARLGGDEFTVIIQDLKSEQDVIHICEKLLHSISQPYTLNVNTVNISASVGVTFYPQDATNTIDLLRYADLAMYAAKEKGRNQFCVFTPEMQESARLRRDALRDLQTALDEDQFVLFYQPIVEMATKRIVKAEALIRWQNPERGLVGPGNFISAAEDSGLIIPIGHWVFTQASTQLARWRASIKADMQISLNVSPLQFDQDAMNYAQWLGFIESIGLPGSALTIEITERLLMNPNSSCAKCLQAFRAAGIQVALDDYGTGYSSLSYLKIYNIDYLKIDQSFVRNLSADSEDLVLCQAIIVMAHQLGMKVIAEGIETELQHELLEQAGCDFGQGYWYSRPVDEAAFTQMLRAAG